MEKALLLVVNEFEAIKDAIIEYRMGNLDNHYALVNAIIARNEVEMWQYIEASDTVQNATGLDMFEKFEVIEAPKTNIVHRANDFFEPTWMRRAIEESEADHAGL